MLSLEGKQLGNYDVIRPIRVGGMGAVYEGRQRTAFGRRVAIKVIHNDYAGDLDMRRRFAREARTIARLQHPHILPLIEFGDEQGILYLVMPLIEGGTLTSYLRHNLPDLDEVASIYRQLLDAVEYAHEEGLIHRDIKSSNVLLEMRRNGPPHVYLADFGLVRVIRHNDSVAAELASGGKPIPLDQVPGTPHYMAPEQTRGIVTPLTDIYALGVLLYQLLTGVLPYNHPDEVRVIQMHLSAPIPSPCDQDASIPYELDEVVRTAMAKHPDDRYQSVSELRNSFLAALSGPVTYGYGAEVRDERQSHHDLYQSYPRQSKSLRDEKGSLPLPPQQTSAMSPEPIVLQRKLTQEPLGRTHESLGGVEDLPLHPSPENTSQTREQPKITHRLDRTDRARTTDSIRGNHDEQEDRNRPRNTEEPVLPPAEAKPTSTKTNKAKRQHLFMLALIAATILAIILIIVLNPLSINIIQKVGGSQATVQITEKPTQIQESYVLTASPQYTTPDPNKFAMPARVLQNSFTEGNTATTTGQKTIPATAAQGIVLFINPGDATVFVAQGQEFITAAGGIPIKLMQSVNVPGKQDGQDGIATAPAIAVNPGKVGNIVPLALNTKFTPPNSASQITAQNPDAFRGGADTQIIHIVTQADIDGLLTNLRNKLTQEAEQQLKSQLVPDEVMATKPTRSENVTSNFPVNTQADQVQVTLTIQEIVTVYKPSVAIQIAATLLKNKANSNLGANYKQVGDITKAGEPIISDVKNDTIILSVTVHGIWVYNFTTTQTDQWRKAIKGLTPAAAQAYFKGQNDIADVQIQLPLGTSHLPTTVDDIRIVFK
jgi:serine/threonine protein kinase